jgi:hypothetical protein
MLEVMKTINHFALIILLLIGSCTQEKRFPLEGAWKIVEFGKWHITDTSATAMINNGLIKCWSKEHFVFVGYFRPDTSIHEYYGAGNYKLNGNKYEEYILYNDYQPLISTKFKALLEIRNDTLIQKYNSDKADSWQLRKGYITEKYVRLK